MTKAFSKKTLENGSMLVVIVILLSLLIFIPIGAQLLKISREQIHRFSSSDAQALNVARAGLDDAIAWFRRQNNGLPVRSQGTTFTYPDAAFFPRQADLSTINESTGLVKDGPLSPIASENKLFYHYEVLRQPTVAFSTGAVHDITDQRIEGHNAGEGLVWYLESFGCVYSQRNPSLPYNVSPNQIVGRARVATEIRRLSMTLTANAAVLINNRGNGTVSGSNVYIIGGSTSTSSGIGVAAHAGAGGSFGTVSGNPASNTSAAYMTDIPSNFQLSSYELRQLADITSTSALNHYPAMGFVCLNGSAVFSSTQTLKGGGVLVVDGNLNVNSGNTNFNGLILATGNVVINSPATISGCLIVGGNLTLNSTGFSDVTIIFDPNVITRISQLLGNYRESRSSYQIFSAVKVEG